MNTKEVSFTIIDLRPREFCLFYLYATIFHLENYLLESTEITKFSIQILNCKIGLYLCCMMMNICTFLIRGCDTD